MTAAGSITGSQLIHLGVGVAVLLAVTYAVLRTAQVPLRWAPLLAILRGTIQLAAVGLALRGVLSAPPTAAAVIVVMLATATWTAGHRLAGLQGGRRAAVIACVCGSVVALGVVFALGVLPFSARYVVALSGIVIGNTMTAATLSGRNLLSGLISRRDEVEAWLSIGATARQAIRDIGRRAAAEALVPAIDQTRTTGVVTLPGAFIGALLGGANPIQAARFQLVVLAAILAAQTIVAVLVVYLLGAPETLPADPWPAAGIT
ncbi:MAG TPA: ABC transporter permease [Mycobacteriales bacterium]|nr:ABC transporter permease [Mycobacteriales bacterium]